MAFFQKKRITLSHALLICAVLALGYVFLAHWTLTGLDPKPSMGLIERRPETFDPLSACVTPFDELLGVANNTPAFSNCNWRFSTLNSNYYNPTDPFDVSRPADTLKDRKVIAGYKHTALDYVIRWMLHNRGLSTSFRERVYELWNVDHFANPFKPGQEYDADYIINHQSAETLEDRSYLRPIPSDIIIYSASKEQEIPNGHAAVIVAVRNDIDSVDAQTFVELMRVGLQPWVLYLAEQNYGNRVWAQANYSRVAYLRWRVDPTGKADPQAYIEDPSGLPVLGRMRVSKQRQAPGLPNYYEDGLNKMDDL